MKLARQRAAAHHSDMAGKRDNDHRFDHFSSTVFLTRVGYFNDALEYVCNV